VWSIQRKLIDWVKATVPTLANGRPAMALPVPVFHRQDHASFAWRTGSLGHAALPRFPSLLTARPQKPRDLP
jgi:hypothetical protein